MLRRPLLLPLVPLYAAGLSLRELRLQRGWEPVRRLRYPVISIGNLSTGGSGKTPLAITLTRLLTDRGFQVDVLSRGYGGRSPVPVRVDPHGSSRQFGDEPLLTARETHVPVFIARERYAAGKLAESAVADHTATGKRVHILDDGFQHRQLARDIEVLLVDREDWHDGLLPAGNLRERIEAAKRASVLVIPANDSQFEVELRTWGWAGPIWRIRRRMDVPRLEGPVTAFCGIARPEQFLSGLRALGVTLAAQHVFPDHYRYAGSDIERILSAARSAGAEAVITTEKDHVRLGNLVSAFSATLPLKTARLAIEFEEERAAVLWIEQRIADGLGGERSAAPD